MTPVSSTHIQIDERGVAWIGGTRVKVTEVVLDKIACEWREGAQFCNEGREFARVAGTD